MGISVSHPFLPRLRAQPQGAVAAGLGAAGAGQVPVPEAVPEAVQLQPGDSVCMSEGALAAGTSSCHLLCLQVCEEPLLRQDATANPVVQIQRMG